MPGKGYTLSSVYAKLEPAIPKNKELININVLQKFTPHALLYITSFLNVNSRKVKISLGKK